MTDVIRTPVREFGLSGLVKDIRPWDVPMQAFTGAQDVRIENASITTFGDVFDTLGPFVDDATGLIDIVPEYADPFWIIGVGSVIMIVFSNGEVRSYYEVSASGPASYTIHMAAGGFDITSDIYSSQSGGFWILTSITNFPQVLVASDVAVPLSLSDMPGWPVDYRAGIFEGYKNMLVAAEIEINGIPSPNLIKWSHPFSTGDTQFFWDATDPTLLAGETPIQSDGQGINGLQPLRDSMMIYFDRSMWRMDFVGGQFVMNFRKVFSDDGAVGKYAFDNVEGKALVVGLRDIYMHDGVQKQSLSDGKISRWFYSQLQIGYPVRVARYPLRNEVWITYRNTPSGDADSCLVYNTLHDAFTSVSLQNVNTGEGDFLSIFLGPRLLSDVITYEDVSQLDPPPDGPTYLDFIAVSYAELFTAPEDTLFYGVSNNPGAVINLDANIGSSRLRRNVLIEHERIDLEQWLPTHGDKVIHISRVYPQFSGIGRLQCRFGVSNSTNDNITWEAWQEFILAEDYAIDFRVAGRYLSFQIKPYTNEFPIFAISGFDVEWAQIGEQ